jgi:hypothetical protein
MIIKIFSRRFSYKNDAVRETDETKVAIVNCNFQKSSGVAKAIRGFEVVE